VSRRRKDKSRAKRRKKREAGKGDSPASAAPVAMEAWSDDASSEITYVRRTPKLVHVAMILVAQAGILAIAYWLARTGSPPARLLLRDVLARPGEQVELVAWLEEDRPPLVQSAHAGSQVSFRRLDEDDRPDVSVLEATIGSDGSVRVSLTAPNEAGVVRYAVTVSSGGDTSAEKPPLTGVLTLQVASADRPLAVATVLHTLTRNLHDHHQLPGARPGARAALDALASKGHDIVYVEFDPLRNSERVRAWIDHAGFPRGALLFPAESLSAAGPGERRAALSAVLEAVRARGRVAWGFAYTNAAVDALSGEGTTVVQIGQASSLRHGGGVIAAVDWTKALAALRLE